MGWLWILVCAFTIADSRAPGTGNSDEVTSLKGSQGSYVVFSLDPKKRNDSQKISWIFESKQQILVITRKNSPDWITNGKQYEGRLFPLSDKSLKLSNLTTKDNGCYEVQITSVSGTISTQKFNLTVLEIENTEPNIRNLGIRNAVLSPGLYAFVVIMTAYVFR